MEIIIVVLLLLIIAALVFAWTSFRPGAPGGVGRARGVRGPRRTAVAARHDPMAEAVERHSLATDPHEAAQEELRLQAQANRVAADLHARQASALESEAHGLGGASRRDAPVYDEQGRPVYVDGQPLYEDDRRAY